MQIVNIKMAKGAINSTRLLSTFSRPVDLHSRENRSLYQALSSDTIIASILALQCDISISSWVQLILRRPDGGIITTYFMDSLYEMYHTKHTLAHSVSDMWMILNCLEHVIMILSCPLLPMIFCFSTAPFARC